jgi:uridine phosphorylase
MQAFRAGQSGLTYAMGRLASKDSVFEDARYACYACTMVRSANVWWHTWSPSGISTADNHYAHLHTSALLAD